MMQCTSGWLIIFLFVSLFATPALCNTAQIDPSAPKNNNNNNKHHKRNLGEMPQLIVRELAATPRPALLPINGEDVARSDSSAMSAAGRSGSSTSGSESLNGSSGSFIDESSSLHDESSSAAKYGSNSGHSGSGPANSGREMTNSGSSSVNSGSSSVNSGSSSVNSGSSSVNSGSSSAKDVSDSANSGSGASDVGGPVHSESDSTNYNSANSGSYASVSGITGSSSSSTVANSGSGAVSYLSGSASANSNSANATSNSANSGSDTESHSSGYVNSQSGSTATASDSALSTSSMTLIISVPPDHLTALPPPVVPSNTVLSSPPNSTTTPTNEEESTPIFVFVMGKKVRSVACRSAHSVQQLVGMLIHGEEPTHGPSKQTKADTTHVEIPRDEGPPSSTSTARSDAVVASFVAYCGIQHLPAGFLRGLTPRVAHRLPSTVCGHFTPETVAELCWKNDRFGTDETDQDNSTQQKMQGKNQRTKLLHTSPQLAFAGLQDSCVEQIPSKAWYGLNPSCALDALHSRGRCESWLTLPQSYRYFAQLVVEEVYDSACLGLYVASTSQGRLAMQHTSTTEGSSNTTALQGRRRYALLNTTNLRIFQQNCHTLSRAQLRQGYRSLVGNSTSRIPLNTYNSTTTTTRRAPPLLWSWCSALIAGDNSEIMKTFHQRVYDLMDDRHPRRLHDNRSTQNSNRGTARVVSPPQQTIPSNVKTPPRGNVNLKLLENDGNHRILTGQRLQISANSGETRAGANQQRNTTQEFGNALVGFAIAVVLYTVYRRIRAQRKAFFRKPDVFF